MPIDIPESEIVYFMEGEIKNEGMVFLKADCDIAEPPTTMNPGHLAFARLGSAQDYAPFANEPSSRPMEDSNREDLQLRPQDADGNQVKDEQRCGCAPETNCNSSLHHQ